MSETKYGGFTAGELRALHATTIQIQSGPVRSLSLPAAAIPAMLDRIAALETERDALGAWACTTCGARFSTPAPPELLKGVTQCTRCVEYQLLGGRVAGLEATVHNKEAVLEAYRIEREQIRAALNGYRDSDLASLAETLTRRNEALEQENKRLSNIEKCTRAYLAVKKSWDNTLRELRTLRNALDVRDDLED